MKYISGISHSQTTFLPECIDDLIAEDNPVRVIDAFVDCLDIETLGFHRYTPSYTGRPGYDPRDLLKLYVYGYFNKFRSSRKLMIECTRNVELFFLLNRITPDFRTIADFRKNNSKAIKNVFSAFVKLCLKLDLYNRELIAIDGSKFRAVNSKMNSYNQDTLNRKIKHIEDSISNYLSQMDNEDSNASDSDNSNKVKAALEELRTRKEKYLGFLDEIKKSGESQYLTTDPEARVMHSKDGFHCSYNVQTAVDSESHLIADFKVTNCCNDQGLLTEVATSAKEMLEVETIETVADKGYESRQDIENCIMNGIVPNVAFKYDQKERIYNYEFIESDITEDIKNSTHPDNIKKCIHAGVLPKCYEKTAISVDIQEQHERLSCFTLNEDGTVTCPMLHTLSKTKMRGRNTIYANKDACRQCTNRCTSSTKYKTVSFGPDSKYVPVKIFGSPEIEVNKIPLNIPINPFNHTLDRKDYTDKRKVILKIKEDIPKMKLRMCLSEHPFGTVKWYHGAHYLLCRGKEKVAAELGLSFLAYNMKRAINMIGIQKLIAAM